jgi:hypothetical protein
MITASLQHAASGHMITASLQHAASGGLDLLHSKDLQRKKKRGGKCDTAFAATMADARQGTLEGGCCQVCAQAVRGICVTRVGASTCEHRARWPFQS